MSKIMKTNIVHTAVWAVVTVGIVLIFAMRGTARNWGNEPWKVIVSAFLVASGFIVDFFIRVYEKSKKNNIIKDERDREIQMEAVYKAFVVLLLYIFVLSAVLYIKYQDAGAVPAGWLWFIAYSAVACANFVAGVFALLGYADRGN